MVNLITFGRVPIGIQQLTVLVIKVLSLFGSTIGLIRQSRHICLQTPKQPKGLVDTGLRQRTHAWKPQEHMKGRGTSWLIYRLYIHGLKAKLHDVTRQVIRAGSKSQCIRILYLKVKYLYLTCPSCMSLESDLYLTWLAKEFYLYLTCMEDVTWLVFQV